MNDRYVAGLFDAEGCVTTSGCRLQTVIATGYVPIAIDLRKEYGGSLYTDKAGTTYWKLSTRQAQKFLLRIESYSIVKQHVIRAGVELADAGEYITRTSIGERMHTLNLLTSPNAARSKGRFTHIRPGDNSAPEIVFPSKISASYLAGFFDGEGCVSVGNKSNGGFTRVNIGNRNKEVLYLYRRYFGGNIYHLGLGLYRYTAHGSCAEGLLKAIKAHLVIKREVALEGLNLLSARSIGLSANDRIVICNRIQILNQVSSPRQTVRS